VNVDAKLAVDRFEVDEDTAHIVLAPDPAGSEFDKLAIACPAGLYRRGAGGGPRFDYAGCLECGTCRILAGDTIIERWQYPGPGMGVRYRY
jgi:ferredoxin-like protein FixX